jgi:hypothetical protein
MTIPLILTTGSRHWLFPSSSKKPFSIAACNAALITCKSEAQNFAGGPRDSEPRTQAHFI